MKSYSTLRFRLPILLAFILSCGLSSAQQGAQLFSFVQEEALAKKNDGAKKRLAQAHRDKRYEQVRAIHLNKNALLANVISVPMPNGETLEFAKKKSEVLFGNTKSWVGTDARTGTRASFVSDASDLHGIISLRSGTYEVVDLGDGVYALVKLRAYVGSEEPPDRPVGVPAKPTSKAAGASHVATAVGSVTQIQIDKVPVSGLASCRKRQDLTPSTLRLAAATRRGQSSSMNQAQPMRLAASTRTPLSKV